MYKDLCYSNFTNEEFENIPSNTKKTSGTLCPRMTPVDGTELLGYLRKVEFVGKKKMARYFLDFGINVIVLFRFKFMIYDFWSRILSTHVRRKF